VRTTQPPVQWVPGLTRGYKSRGVVLTTHPLLAPRSRKSRAIPLPPPLLCFRGSYGVPLSFTAPFHLTSKHFTSHQNTSPHIKTFHLTSLHFTSHHYTSPHITTLHLISLQFTSHHNISPHITTLHLTSLHFTSHHNSSPHITTLHLTSLHCTLDYFRHITIPLISLRLQLIF
jgi:hypothetical protein